MSTDNKQPKQFTIVVNYSEIKINRNRLTAINNHMNIQKNDFVSNFLHFSIYTFFKKKILKKIYD